MTTRSTSIGRRQVRAKRLRIAETCTLCGLDTLTLAAPLPPETGLVLYDEQTWHRGCWLLRNSVVGWILGRGAP